MRSRFPTPPLPSGAEEFADDVRRTFLQLGLTYGDESLAGQCSPALDVYERDESVEIVVDLPGVDLGSLRVAFKRDAVLIVGHKAPRRPGTELTFHLVERDFGRFVRVVRVGRACDASRARARLGAGELHISLPKILERRGQTISIPISGM